MSDKKVIGLTGKPNQVLINTEIGPRWIDEKIIYRAHQFARDAYAKAYKDYLDEHIIDETIFPKEEDNEKDNGTIEEKIMELWMELYLRRHKNNDK